MADLLVVDDDPSLRRLLRMVLEMDGHRVQELEDGEDVSKWATSEPTDAVILDIMMPNVDGLTALAQLRAEADRHVPVILLTAKNAARDRQAGLDAGADAYLTKPFDPELLSATINLLVAA